MNRLKAISIVALVWVALRAGHGLAVPPFLPPATAVVGTKGGTITLDNGIRIQIGANAFPGPTRVSVYPANGVPTRGGAVSFDQLEWAFRVEPSLKGVKVNVKVPDSLIPEGYDVELVKLDLNGPPICDRDKCKGDFYMSGQSVDGFTSFDVSGLDTVNILQVAIQVPRKERMRRLQLSQQKPAAKPEPTRQQPEGHRP